MLVAMAILGNSVFFHNTKDTGLPTTALSLLIKVALSFLVFKMAVSVGLETINMGRMIYTARKPTVTMVREEVGLMMST